MSTSRLRRAALAAVALTAVGAGVTATASPAAAGPRKLYVCHITKLHIGYLEDTGAMMHLGWHFEDALVCYP